MFQQDGGLLTAHPTLTACLEAIVGPAWHSAAPLRVLGSWHAGLAERPSRVPLHAGAMDARQPGYAIKNGERHCRALTAVWALTDTVPGGGYTVLAASHKSTVPTPRSFHDGSGLGWLEQRGVALEPQLRAGSLLVVVGGVLHGLRPGTVGDGRHDGRQRLVECKFGKGAAPEQQPLAQLPSLLPWTALLTPRQHRIVGLIEDAEPPAGDIVRRDEVMVAEDTEMLREQYMWDLCGWLVVKGVMDGGQLDAANGAVDAMEPRSDPAALAAAGQTEDFYKKQFPDGFPGEQAEVSQHVLGGAGMRINGGMGWESPLCLPFHEMIGHTALMERLDWILGE